MTTDKIWNAILWLGILFLCIAFGALIALPSKWDKAVALKICRDGTPILRMSDGSIWARRNGFVAYQVEDWKTVC